MKFDKQSLAIEKVCASRRLLNACGQASGRQSESNDSECAKSTELYLRDNEQLHDWKHSDIVQKGDWLGSIEIGEPSDSFVAGLSELLSTENTRRVSSKGFVNVPNNSYPDIHNWMRRNLASDKRAVGSIQSLPE